MENSADNENEVHINKIQWESQTVHSKSNKREMMVGYDTDEVVGELLDGHLHSYKIGLKQPMEGSNFMFGYLDGLHYKCHKISLNRCGSYI